MEAKRRAKSGDKGGIFVILAVELLFCEAACGQAWDGKGVEGGPYQIWTVEDMQAIGADSNY